MAQVLCLSDPKIHIFDDGHSDPLRWTIHKMAGGQYINHENRLDGEAVGEQAGCAFHLVRADDLVRATVSTVPMISGLVHVERSRQP